MLKRYYPPKHDHLLLSDSETDSDDLSEGFWAPARPKRNTREKPIISRRREKTPIDNGENKSTESSAYVKAMLKDINHPAGDEVVKRAKEYQEYMKQLPIPKAASCRHPFKTWQELAESMKKEYGQPLHYLTLVLLKQWDESRRGASDENNPIGNVIHPRKAEAAIWVVEEFNRHSSSYHYLAKLWLSDPNYHDLVYPVIPRC